MAAIVVGKRVQVLFLVLAPSDGLVTSDSVRIDSLAHIGRVAEVVQVVQVGSSSDDTVAINVLTIILIVVLQTLLGSITNSNSDGQAWIERVWIFTSGSPSTTLVIACETSKICLSVSHSSRDCQGSLKLHLFLVIIINLGTNSPFIFRF